jgi:hypothetical protein
VVFDDAERRRRPRPASESISSTRLMPGSLPFESSSFISPPRTDHGAHRVEEVRQHHREHHRERGRGAEHREEVERERPDQPEVRRVDDLVRDRRDPVAPDRQVLASFTMIARTVETKIPISRGPLDLRATSAALNASPTTKIPIGHVVSSPARPSGVGPVL